jgi:type IV secretory pathway TrbL component
MNVMFGPSPTIPGAGAAVGTAVAIAGGRVAVAVSWVAGRSSPAAVDRELSAPTCAGVLIPSAMANRSMTKTTSHTRCT